LKKKDIEYIISFHKWPFKISDLWNRYFILLAPLFFIYLSILITLNTGLKTDGTISKSYLIFFVVMLFLIGLFIGWYTLVRLKKESLFHLITVTSEQRQNLTDHIKKIGWTISEIDSNYIIANTKISLSSWGEEITIILRNNEILFNSRPTGLQPFTFNRDKINFMKFSDFSP
jgi:hypothetical protein